ncbi:uncharacterized protein C5L36_0A09370 [Pichia kudriavzevii]|uniref:CBS domain-containing protein n=1 Tax=Pichia kudriavzevii TaxID=4909 RepID=A0A099NZ02_PICKU|nr:uncharacterized protein C5L36_0A09370 [Pichia kudriavzevii]AWU74345.1 hypothetical protein C5L36_0A09370 [Pichia kudriavzevii]KGK37147.1 hypothetical protein JL09_g3729 [Pichia kudriavzevii]
MNGLSRLADPPVICNPQTSIYNAALLMKEQRTHCLLILHENTHQLVGLTTTKDLAFKAVAKCVSLDTPIGEMMTLSPWFVPFTTTPNEALKLMVERRIRHLPIVDGDKLVLGVLNITTCFYNVMIRLEKMSEKSRELQCTFNELNNTEIANLINGGFHLDGANSNMDLVSMNEELVDLNISRRTQKIVNDLKSLIEIMKQPDLKSLLDGNELNVRTPFYIDSKTLISDAAKLLMDNDITAVLVVHSLSSIESSENIIGILTTKDLVFRVLALKIDSKSSKVTRIMTPKPEFANDSMEIHNALRLMYEGKYMNLPIKNHKNEIKGLVNVLDLTYSLLHLLNDNSHFLEESCTGQITTNKSNTLAWNKFWDSLNKPLTVPSPRHSFSIDPKLSRRSPSSTSVTRDSISSFGNVNMDPSESLKSLTRNTDNSLIRPNVVPMVKTFKIKIIENLELGLNGNIYKCKLSCDQSFNSFLSQIYCKIPSTDFLPNLTYLDENDKITVDTIDELTTLPPNTLLYLSLKPKPSKCFKFTITLPTHYYDKFISYSKDVLVIGGIGVFITLLFKSMYLHKH